MEYKLNGGNRMKCTACSKELNRKEVVYTEDKQPYCPNPFTCNEDHPNSVLNILARGGALKLFTEEELEDNIFERLHITEEMKDRILKVATKPQSIRLSKYEIAYYLLMLQEEMELSSISEAVRYCVNLAMVYRPIGNGGKLVPIQPKGEPTEEIIEVVEAEPVGAQELAEKAIKLTSDPIVVPAMPKSINVDWSNLPKIEPEPEEEKEDEFTF
jgi:hypothetical protein